MTRPHYTTHLEDEPKRQLLRVHHLALLRADAAALDARREADGEARRQLVVERVERLAHVREPPLALGHRLEVLGDLAHHLVHRQLALEVRHVLARARDVRREEQPVP